MRTADAGCLGRRPEQEILSTKAGEDVGFQVTFVWEEGLPHRTSPPFSLSSSLPPSLLPSLFLFPPSRIKLIDCFRARRRSNGSLLPDFRSDSVWQKSPVSGSLKDGPGRTVDGQGLTDPVGSVLGCHTLPRPFSHHLLSVSWKSQDLDFRPGPK